MANCNNPLATYISNTAYNSAACLPSGANFYTTATYASLANSDGVSSLCNRNCNADIQRCKAYVANAIYDEDVRTWGVDCYLFTTQAPSPTLCQPGKRVATDAPTINGRQDTPNIDALVSGLQNVNDALTTIATNAQGDPVTALPVVLAGLVALVASIATVPVPAVGSLTELPNADLQNLCGVTSQVTDSVTNLVGVVQALISSLPLLGGQLSGPLANVQTGVNGLLDGVLAGGLDCGRLTMTSSLTTPTLSSTSLPVTITPPVGTVPDVHYAAYRDDVVSCFSQSVTAAVRYCSFLLSKPPPSTKFSYTSTSTPMTTKTTTKVTTTSVCTVKRGPAARGAADFLEHDAEEKRDPAPFDMEPRAGPVSAPAPRCLQPNVYPGWNSERACSCLASITALTQTTVSVAPTATRVITKTKVTSVQKPSVPTFKPKASFPGSAANGGGAFNIISRMVPDAKGTSKRILLYSRPNVPSAGQAAMHVGTAQSAPKAVGKLFGVSMAENNLYSFGQVAFATASGAVNVIGQLPNNAKPAQSFSSCTQPRAASPQLTCKLANGDPAVFFEVPVKGQKGTFAIGIAARKAPNGAKVLTLQSTAFGTVIVGCGGK